MEKAESFKSNGLATLLKNAPDLEKQVAAVRAMFSESKHEGSEFVKTSSGTVKRRGEREADHAFSLSLADYIELVPKKGADAAYDVRLIWYLSSRGLSTDMHSLQVVSKNVKIIERKLEEQLDQYKEYFR